MGDYKGDNGANNMQYAATKIVPLKVGCFYRVRQLKRITAPDWVYYLRRLISESPTMLIYEAHAYKPDNGTQVSPEKTIELRIDKEALPYWYNVTN